jgi:hypothetical protein
MHCLLHDQPAQPEFGWKAYDTHQYHSKLIHDPTWAKEASWKKI